MIKYLRNLCLLTGVDNGEVDGGVELVPYLNSLVATDEFKKLMICCSARNLQ